MSSNSGNDPQPIIDLSSSDDDEDHNNNAVQHHKTQKQSHLPQNPRFSEASSAESRSFWRAGNYDAVATPSPYLQGKLEHARVHPKFLHSNATSHRWAFGAIAELLDNAVDEICNGATFVKVDKIYNMRDNSPALLFQDNGGGMDPDCMRKCMSLGYSSKKTNSTIGQYGNGFKTSTMRLGADAVVFSRRKCERGTTQSIGLLSYTFLRKTGQDDIIVPMVDFQMNDHRAQPIIYSSQDAWRKDLQLILDWSPFVSEEELMLQFEDVEACGTKVIIYNLWLNDDGLLELDFDEDEEDIRLRDDTNYEHSSKIPREIVQSHISYSLRRSLRAYASVLYLKKFPNFQIILMGKPIQQLNIAEELIFPKVITYRPQVGTASKEIIVETTIGFVKEAPLLHVHGFNIYHKNRLIKPFFRVLPYGATRGSGVVGVLEANFIEPAHDKQDFERTSLFIRLEMRLKQMINEYWRSHCHLIGLTTPGAAKRVNLTPGVEVTIEHGLPIEQPVISLATLQKEPVGVSPISGIGAPSGIDSDGAAKKVACVDNAESRLVDKLSEENIQLFMRCEGHRQKQAELKQTIENLEADLKEARRKCSHLSSNIEIQRKQIMKQ